MSWLAPLARAQCPREFDPLFALTEQVMGFVPNSMLTMARDPDLLAAFAQLSAVVVVRPGRLDVGLKAMVMQVASQAAGCRYCAAHSANLAAARHVSAEKVAALWDYERSPLFDTRERAVLRLAQLGARAPSEAGAEDFVMLRAYLDDEEILELVAVIAFMGFLNRWNDILATSLEGPPRAFAEQWLAPSGWSVGAHRDDNAQPTSRRRLPLKVRFLMWLVRRWGPKPAFVSQIAQPF